LDDPEFRSSVKVKKVAQKNANKENKKQRFSLKARSAVFWLPLGLFQKTVAEKSRCDSVFYTAFAVDSKIGI